MKTLDTRDLYTRKCELESLRDAVTEAREAMAEAARSFDLDALNEARRNLRSAESDFGTDEQEELTELESLESDISDFMHGETMIPESDFEEYARELAEDMGTMEGSEWPCTCIDWEKAADELRQDYTSVTYQGTEYLVRA